MPSYIIYTRKSSESEDRQVLSIPAQISELKAQAHREGLTISAILEESQSAKAPGRPIFNQLLNDIGRKRVHGILSWKLDRLARNPVDGAALIWALQQGTLKSIVTPQRTFTNRSDDKFWMQLEFGIAKKYIDDLSDNVKRGNRAKLERGWVPGRPPLGYLNDRDSKTIIPDPDRLPLIRKAFEFVLAGHSPAFVLRRLNRDWGFQTRASRRRGGGPMGTSHLYRLLSNPFYCGLIRYNGETHLGKHNPILTVDEFDEVQRLLGRPNRLHTHKHAFAYTGLIRCGECTASVTAEHKVNRFGSHYTYYHCTKRPRSVRCSQKNIEVRALERQVLDFIRTLTIDDEVASWAMERARSESATDEVARRAVIGTLASTEAGIQAQKRRLTDLSIRGAITIEEFDEARGELLKRELQLQQQRERAADNRGWLELFTKSIILANEAEKRFLDGDILDKREIIMAAGSNFVLKDRTLHISARKPLLLISQEGRLSRFQGLSVGIRTLLRSSTEPIHWPSWVNAAASKLLNSS